jgi:hypothetical protein
MTDDYSTLDDRPLQFILSRICIDCKHFKPPTTSKRTCDVFPEGIPVEIWEGRNNHKEPYEGDHGIQFEHF